MDHQNSSDRLQRQMFNISSKGITCEECKNPITELPFEPTERKDGGYGKLYCYECNKKRMKDRGLKENFGGGNRY
ncbi:MAG: hypothetical protein KAQ64_01195 [Candidatus Pacebacteria bacterium]|nr:hypothetical protein [Candidatus Paceibacterota bacterium]